MVGQRAEMTPKILLVNYSKAEANNVEKATGLKVLRGYLSEIDTYTVEHDGTKKSNIKFYSPEAYYECAITLINLPRNKALKDEFDEKANTLTDEDINNMASYWQTPRQLMVLFAGDTNINNLWNIGIPLILKKSSGNDTKKVLGIDEENELYGLVSMLEGQIKMPTDKYILSGFKPKSNQYDPDPYYDYGTRWNVYIANANQDFLVCSLSKSRDDYHGETPGAIIIPQPKVLSTTTTKVIEFFGEYYGIYTPGADWQDSNQFYPQAKLRELTKEIADIRAKAEAESQAKQSLIDEHKEAWGFLHQLVTEQGDKLVKAVYRVLDEVLRLKVTDSDDEKEGEPIEDLLIEFKDRKVLIEVKGTAKSNAPLEYTQQPFQHIVRRGYEGRVEAGLILNHDMKKDPQYRKSAYTDTDKEGLIADLYFIDTRTLLAVAIAVIDGELSQKDAVTLLFGSTGRITYPNAKGDK
jgi:hypothetical protein